jgi:hypothetical protein
MATKPVIITAWLTDCCNKSFIEIVIFDAWKKFGKSADAGGRFRIQENNNPDKWKKLVKKDFLQDYSPD